MTCIYTCSRRVKGKAAPDAGCGFLQLQKVLQEREEFLVTVCPLRGYLIPDSPGGMTVVHRACDVL